MDAPRADSGESGSFSNCTSRSTASGASNEGASAERARATGRTVGAARLLGTGLVTQPRVLSWLAPLAWAALIFVLSSGQPALGGLELGVYGSFLMNLAHPGVFGVLALLLIPLFARRVGPHGLRWTALTPVMGTWLVAFVAMYGFTDEVHQSTVAGRDASLLDFLSDTVGAFFVVAVTLYLGREDANTPGLLRWLLAGLAASMASAGLATWYSVHHGAGPWPF